MLGIDAAERRVGDGPGRDADPAMMLLSGAIRAALGVLVPDGESRCQVTGITLGRIERFLDGALQARSSAVLAARRELRAGDVPGAYLALRSAEDALRRGADTA